jgi:hypothetical protein
MRPASSSGLLPTGATLTLHDLEDAKEKLPAVVDLVGRWMRAAA